jgi:serine protease Do
VVDDLQQYQEVRRGSIGEVWFQPLTTQMAEELGAPDTRGAFVNRMARASAAYQAGLRPGDVVIRFNGTTVEEPGHLWRLVSDAPIGSTATVTIVREGRGLDLRVPIIRPARN